MNGIREEAGQGAEGEHDSLRIGGAAELRAHAPLYLVQRLVIQPAQSPEAQMLQQMADALVLLHLVEAAALEIEPEVNGMKMRLTAAQQRQAVGQVMLAHS